MLVPLTLEPVTSFTVVRVTTLFVPWKGSWPAWLLSPRAGTRRALGRATTTARFRFPWPPPAGIADLTGTGDIPIRSLKPSPSAAPEEQRLARFMLRCLPRGEMESSTMPQSLSPGKARHDPPYRGNNLDVNPRHPPPSAPDDHQRRILVCQLSLTRYAVQRRNSAMCPLGPNRSVDREEAEQQISTHRRDTPHLVSPEVHLECHLCSNAPFN